MKAIRYISLLLTLSITILISSCSDETISQENGDGEHVRISLSIPNKAVVTPLTKSGATQADANKVTSLKILVYKDGKLQQSESEVYSSVDGADTKLESLSEGNTVNYSLKIKSGGREVYLIANDDLELDDASLQTIDDLKAISFMNNGNSPEMIMFDGPHSCNPETNPSITASLERIYSMVTVQLLTNLHKGITIVPTSLTIKNIPDRGRLLSPNEISENGVECVIEGASLSSDDRIDLSVDHDKATPFFLYENMQPDGKNKTGTDQTKKTPADFDLDDPEDAIKTDRKCSYIEIKAKYLIGGEQEVPGAGTITYRFFLGNDAVNNFEVKRNTWYKLTLTLNGDGGKDEATWRVDTDLMDDVTLESLYIGYKVNSEAILAAENGVKFKIEKIESEDGKARFVYDLNEDGSYTIRANITNVHDYKKLTGTITYNVGKATKTAHVYQVPRLVDPIAIYKHAENDNPTEIVVKEYKHKGDNYPNNGYYPLISKGKWKATVEKGGWFTIGKNKTDEGKKMIEGEGEVRFYLKNGKSNNETRYGKILVHYHNENCPHEIFLRQGYARDADTEIGTTKWSVFNCLGINSSGAKEITTFPTETGWFFHGGYNEAMNPYNPGFLKEDPVIWSTGNDVEHTDKNYIKDWNVKEKGPCPSGYKIASIADYKSLVKNTIAYSGFIHDDSNGEGGYTRNSTNADPVGWHYDSNHNMVADNSNYCNPAKGSLFVSKSDNATNVFFTYGKGVLERTSNDDYINEIGVGHRILSNLTWVLNYSTVVTRREVYGAIYWTSTKGSESGNGGNINYWGKADFWYNVEGTTYLIDEATYEGLRGLNNGNFVRCVRAE